MEIFEGKKKTARAVVVSPELAKKIDNHISKHGLQGKDKLLRVNSSPITNPLLSNPLIRGSMKSSITTVSLLIKIVKSDSFLVCKNP